VKAFEGSTDTMSDDLASSRDDRANDDRNRITVPTAQCPVGLIQNLGQNHYQNIVNPTSSLAVPGIAANAALSTFISSMLGIYQMPPYGSVSTDQIARVLNQTSSGGSTQVMAVPCLQSQQNMMMYSTVQPQNFRGPTFSATVTNSNSSGNPSVALGSNVSSHNNNNSGITNPNNQSASLPRRDSDNSAARPSTTAQHAAQHQISNYSRILYLPQDEDNLSRYQCLARQHIELFQAAKDDLSEKSQGRNRPITLGQVGIRCRHCGKLPSKKRAKGGKFFPSNLGALYQTAQNLANTHLVVSCTEIPASDREDLIRLRSHDKNSKTCKSAHGSGKDYWSNCLRVMGVVDTVDRRLFFKTL
jgi:hypothetical protein